MRCVVACNGSAGLRARLLGPFVVEVGGQPVSQGVWPRRKTQSLLKFLLTEPEHVFAVDQLIDAVLPDADPTRAASNIHARISELRRVLEPNLKRGSDSRFIMRSGEGYAFHADSCCWIDTLAFEGGLAEGHRAADHRQWPEAVETFEKALALYRGEFLSEDLYEEWTAQPRERFAEEFVGGLSRLGACYAKLGRMRQAISCCQRALEVTPHRESAVAQLMTYYAKAGERAKALTSYDAAADRLRDQLDVEPSADLQRLRDSIAHQPVVESLLACDPRRIAVIPLVTVGMDPSNQALADGMTEELIYALSNVAGLEVIAQTTVLKYKGSGKSVAEIGSELRVGTVLEGSVQRAQDRARVLIQLIDVSREAHIWSQQYDRRVDDVLRIQADIARHTAAVLRVRLLPKEERTLDENALLDRRAQAAYIKGRQMLGKRGPEACREAIACFERVLAIAPHHTRGLTGLADAYVSLVDFESATECFEKAMHYAQEALAVDPGCAEAHAMRARVLFLHRGDVVAAEQAVVRAIDANPNCAVAHALYAELLEHTGRLAAACERSEIGLSLDPLSAPLVLSHAQSLHAAGRIAEAVDQYRKAIEIDPHLENAWWGLWYSLAAAWDWDRAEAITRQTVDEHPENPFAYVNLATCVMCRGRLEEGLAVVHKALAVDGAAERTSILFHAGACHYFAREYDVAIDYLREVLERNPRWLSAHNMIAKCHIQQERYEDALEELAAAEGAFGGAIPFWQAHVHMDRGRVYAHLGETEKAERELATLKENPGRQNYRIAVSGLLRALGRVEESLDWVEAAATAREPHIAALRKAPELDAIRSHPRFLALLKRVGLDGDLDG